MTQAELRAEVAKIPGARFESATGTDGHSYEGVWLRKGGKDYEMSADTTNVPPEIVALMRDTLLKGLQGKLIEQ